MSLGVYDLSSLNSNSSSSQLSPTKGKTRLEISISTLFMPKHNASLGTVPRWVAALTFKNSKGLESVLPCRDMSYSVCRPACPVGGGPVA